MPSMPNLGNTKSGVGIFKSVLRAACHNKSIVMSHFSTQLNLPSERNPEACKPHGCPLLEVFVLQQEPRTDSPSKQSDEKLHRCASANLKLAQVQIKIDPIITSSVVGHEDINILRSS